eukprot:4925921-Pyramimonas_sp.AAC.1
MVIGAGGKRNLGCALLLDTVQPYGIGPSGPRCFKTSDVRVLHSSERLLICKVRIFDVHEIVYIAHAVNLGHPTLDYKNWWS